MISFVESKYIATFAVMKKTTIINRWILMLKCISIIIAVSACSSDDDLKNSESQDSYDLYKTWVLVSYGDNTVEIMKAIYIRSAFIRMEPIRVMHTEMRC